MSDLIQRVRMFEQDHAPDGYPAITMREVSALAAEIERVGKQLADTIEFGRKEYLRANALEAKWDEALTQRNAAERQRDEAVAALRELEMRTENFWAFVQGEYGVKISSADHEDHNVYEFFAALESARRLLKGTV